jgi:ketopantoate reductase
MGEQIVMLGAGAVGGHVGGHLALHGHDVTLIDFWSENIEAIRSGEGICGSVNFYRVAGVPPRGCSRRARSVPAVANRRRIANRWYLKCRPR